jgi:integrase
MSTLTASRLFVSDLIPLILNGDLSATAKRDMISAVKAVARVLQADPSTIELNVGALRRRLEGISPETLGLSSGRWANVRSLFGKALALALPVMPSRTVMPLLESWEDLASQLPENRRVRLLALLRFLSSRDVGPEAVTLVDLEDYHRAITEDRLRANPEGTWDAIVWAWNVSVRDVEGWPKLEIPRQQKREIYTLAWEALPSSYRQDVERLIARMGATSLEDEEGPPKPMRPATLKTRTYQLRVAASALAVQGVPLADITSIAVLVRFENLQKILRFLLDRHEGKTSPQVAQIATFLKICARHWVKVSDEELVRIGKLAARVQIPRQGMTPKNRQRLRPFDDDEVVVAFLQLPERLREEVEKELQKHGRMTKPMAVKAQVAAALALLQAAPMRRKNLASLRISDHLISRGKKLYLVIPEAEVKNSELIDFELPAEVVRLLAWYVKACRPTLLERESDALFPGAKGEPKSPNTLAIQIKGMVERYLGIAFNVHLARHAMGKLFLDARPGQYEVMRRVLSHRSIATTTLIYTGAETKSAGSHFASVIAERRRSMEEGMTPRRPRVSVKSGRLGKNAILRAQETGISKKEGSS